MPPAPSQPFYPAPALQDRGCTLAFDKKTLVLPRGTVFEEHLIVVDGDVILGNHVVCGFGLKTPKRVFAGQGVELGGSVDADGDVRIDQSSQVQGDVRSRASVYLGERCFVQGDLEVDGDLDVGDDVRVGKSLKAKGFVQKRNPVPIVIYVFIYLLELLRLGQSAEVERILAELEEADDVGFAVDEGFLFIPDGSKVGLQETDVKGGLEAGEDVRILGNMTVHGPAVLRAGSRVLGALKADGDVDLGRDCEVQGEVRSQGTVRIGPGAQVLGSLHAQSVVMYPGATVDGRIHAVDGVQFSTEAHLEAERTAQAKVEEFQGKSADLVDLLG